MTAQATCLWCGGTERIELHHITGRNPTGDYLDPELVVPLCRDCHFLAGADARAERIETPAGRQWSLLASVEWWLQRAAVFVSRCCDSFDFPWLVALAVSLRRNADALTAQIEILDLRFPNWHLATHPLNQGTPQ